MYGYIDEIYRYSRVCILFSDICHAHRISVLEPETPARVMDL